jgi:hypothetical protein
MTPNQLSSALLFLLCTSPVRAEAQLIVPGPPTLISDVCDNLKPIYPNTQLTDIGDGLFTTATAYPNLNYAGFHEDYDRYPYTVVIYNPVNSAVPNPAGGVCWTASVNYLEGDPGTQVYDNPTTCYSNDACRITMAGPRPRKVIESRD